MHLFFHQIVSLVWNLRKIEDMAQAFERDDELCRKYAKFAADLDRWHFKIIYWFMFVLNLVILFIASWTYTR